MDANRTWIMVDIEASGPIYGRHAMTEIGAAVGSLARGRIDSFEAIIRPETHEPVTSRGSYERALREGEDPAVAMKRFAQWCKPFQDQGARFIARPAAFDWPWIVYYAWTYLRENPFGFKAVCASSWLEAHGKRFQVRLPHVAVQDAEIQLDYFLKVALGAAFTTAHPKS